MIVAPPSRFPWPPVLYFLGLLAAVALNAIYPLPWIGQPLSDLLFAFGVILVAGAVALDLYAMRELKRGNTTIMPTKAADHLIVAGPFGFTRNPIYLGNTALLIGIGLVTHIAWFIPAALLAAFATQKLAIEPEEKHLAKRFGKKFHDYAKRVRRWI